MATLHNNITQIKNIFEAIANAIRSKLGEDAIDKCDGPDTYAEKILLIGTGSSECPDCPECPDPDIPNTPEVTILTNGPLTIEKEGNILVQYKNYDSIKDPIFTEDWLTITSSQEEDVYNYIVNCETNESRNDRTVDVTFSCTKENLTAFNKITIIQPFYEAVTKTSVTCDETLYISSSEELEEWKTINVTYIDPNEIFDPECNYNNLDKWFDWKRFSDGHYAVFVNSNNSNETREGTITFSCSDALGNKYSATCKIIQEPTEKGPSIVIFPTEWKNISADGGAKTFAVTMANVQINESGYYYHIDSYPNWISFTMASSSFTVTAEANSTEESRSGKIQVSCTGTNGTTIFKMIDVEQLGAESEELYLNVSVESNTISYEGGNVVFTIDTNSVYDINSPSDYSRIEAKEPTRAIINIYKNESVDSRELTFIFTCTEDSSISKTIKITQTGNELPVSISVTPTTWEVPAEGGTIIFKVDVENEVPNDMGFSYTLNWAPTWIRFTDFGGNECYTVAGENTNTESRTDKIILLAKGNGEDNEATATITVTQLGQTVIDPTPQSSPMYYGYIPYMPDDPNDPADYSEVTGDYILKCVNEYKTITKVDQATTMGKTSFGVVPKYSMLLIAVPSDSGLVATMDNGIGGKVPFSVSPYSNGEYTVTIDGIAYSLYGEYTSINYPEDSTFFYID